jgi:hypothetical protein
MPTRLLAILLLVATAVLPPLAATVRTSDTVRGDAHETARGGCCGAECRCDANCPCAARDESPDDAPAPPAAPTSREDPRIVANVPAAPTESRPDEAAPRAPPLPGVEHGVVARRPAGRVVRKLSGSWHE